MNATTIFLAIYQSLSEHSSLMLKKKKKKLKKLYGSILWMEFTCLKDTKPLRGDSSLFAFRFSGVPGTHFIKLKRIKTESTLEPLSGFEPLTP